MGETERDVGYGGEDAWLYSPILHGNIGVKTVGSVYPAVKYHLIVCIVCDVLSRSFDILTAVAVGAI
jgi:hypothetical protein